MEIDKLIVVMNNELKKSNLSVNKICDKLGLKQSTVKMQIRKSGYIFNAELRQYIKENSVGHIVGQTSETIENTNSEVVVIHSEDNVGHVEKTDNINLLMNNFDVLMEMINKYKASNILPLNENVIHEGDIVLQLPFEDDKSFKASYRINKTVHEQFKEFCKKHKNFSQKDLMSMALVEYMEKYKK